MSEALRGTAGSFPHEKSPLKPQGCAYRAAFNVAYGAAAHPITLNLLSYIDGHILRSNVCSPGMEFLDVAHIFEMFGL